MYVSSLDLKPVCEPMMAWNGRAGRSRRLTLFLEATRIRKVYVACTSHEVLPSYGVGDIERMQSRISWRHCLPQLTIDCAYLVIVHESFGKVLVRLEVTTIDRAAPLPPVLLKHPQGLIRRDGTRALGCLSHNCVDTSFADNDIEHMLGSNSSSTLASRPRCRPSGC